MRCVRQVGYPAPDQRGATKADLAASIFQAVVNQTISGLACEKPIRGSVAFLGGPLHFLPELKKAFIRTLQLTPETTVDPENSHLFAAMTAGMELPENVKGIVADCGFTVKMTYENYKTCVAPKKLFVVPDLLKK